MRLSFKNKSGQTFVIVMMLTGILMIAGASLTFLTSNAAYTSRKISSGACAMAIAEAGVADRISRMSMPGQYAVWATRSNTVAYGGGRFTVVGTMKTNMVTIIRSTGEYDGETRTTVLELLGTIYDLWDSVVTATGAIVAGGNITLKNPVTVFGDLRCNGSIIGSPAPTINGSVTCVGSADFAGTGGATTGAPPVGIPDERLVIDVWRQRAKTDPNYYFTNSKSWSGATLTPASGVIFVEGNIDLGQRNSVRGTLVATGYIHIGQNLVDFTAFNPANNWPCVIACLDFEDANNNIFPGDIFAGTTITMSNRRTVYGMIIAMQTVTILQNNTIISTNGPPAWDPNDTNTASPPIVFGGWLQ